MSSLTITVAPAEEPISLAEAKEHMRVDSSDEDGLIAGLITAAREYSEKLQGRAYVTRTYEYVTDVATTVELPMPPCVTMSKIEALDETDSWVEATGTLWLYNTCAKVISIEVPAGAKAVRITYTAGYGGAADVPQTIKQALLLLVAYWYENREAAVGGTDVKTLPYAYQALINLDRVNWC